MLEKLMLRDSNGYSGDNVVTHTIRQGETLSSIARRYGFKSYSPIWIYNTQVHRVLRDDPDRVAAGVTIFIPRSERGYERLIKKFKVLQMEIQYSGDREMYLLESDYDLHQANRIKLDFVGDVLTTIVTVGLQARKAAEVAAAAKKVVGSERVAAEYLAEKEAEKLKKALDEAFVDKLKDAAKDKGSSDMSDEQKERFEKPYIAVFKSSPKALKAIRGFSLQGGKFLLDVSEIVLDYFKPSTVADFWLAHVTGVGSPKEVYESTRAYVGSAIARSCTQLNDKIVQFEKERDLVYSPGQNAAQTALSAAP